MGGARREVGGGSASGRWCTVNSPDTLRIRRISQKG